MDSVGRAELYQAEVDEARRAIDKWLVHEAAAGIVAAVAPDFAQITERLEIQFPELRLHDQGQVALFAVAAIGEPSLTWGVVAPDGTVEQWPDLSDWLSLPEDDQREVRGLCDSFDDALRRVARSIEAAGAAIDPVAPCDLVVLAQLLVTSSAPPFKSDDFCVFGPSAISRDGRGTSSERDGRGTRDRARTDSLQWDWRERQPDYRGGLRDRGGRPKGAHGRTSDTEKLRTALPILLAEYPDGVAITARTLRREWRSGASSSPGKRLRTLMGRNASDPTPGENSIRTVLREIRANNL